MQHSMTSFKDDNVDYKRKASNNIQQSMILNKSCNQQSTLDSTTMD